MARCLGAFAALAALSGCHDEPEVLVHNQGTQPVIVEIIADDWDGGHDHDVFELPAGGLFKDDYPADEVEVIISRKSDGLILFASVFDGEDFEDDHGTIEIVVTP
jgi:hypothetical protein